MKIDDGTGSGYQAKVDSRNRITTTSVVVGGEADAITLGNGYQVSSGQVSYTNANAIPTLYICNGEEEDLVIDRIIVMLGTSNGTGDWNHQILRNPTAGTIISNAVSAGISNSNHGSTNVLNNGASIFKGVVGDTLTGGTGVALPIKETSDRLVFPVGRRIPKGQSIGVVITPPAGNTSAISVTVVHLYKDIN